MCASEHCPERPSCCPIWLACCQRDGGEGVKQRFLCTNCEYNWRGCHNPRRPNVTRDEGCKDFWPKGRKTEPQLDKLDSAWVEGLDLRGLGKKGKGKPKK